MNSLNLSVNGLNRMPTRKDSGEEGRPGGGQQGDGGVVKANKGGWSSFYLWTPPSFLTNQNINTFILSRYLQQLITVQDDIIVSSKPTGTDHAAHQAWNRQSPTQVWGGWHDPSQRAALPPWAYEEDGDGNDLMMGLEEDGMGMGMGMKGSLSPDSMEGERDGELDRLEERGRMRGVMGLKVEVQSDDSLLGM